MQPGHFAVEWRLELGADAAPGNSTATAATLGEWLSSQLDVPMSPETVDVSYEGECGGGNADGSCTLAVIIAAESKEHANVIARLLQSEAATATDASAALGLAVATPPTTQMLFVPWASPSPPTPPPPPPWTWASFGRELWRTKFSNSSVAWYAVCVACSGLALIGYLVALLCRCGAGAGGAAELAPVGVPPLPRDGEEKEVRADTLEGVPRTEEELLKQCAAPMLVADLGAVREWMGATPKGPGNMPPSGDAKPARYKLPGGEPFVMVSYQQAWCKGDWALMAEALAELQAAGWRHVWTDVAIVTVDETHPYVQAHFESAMRFAVLNAAAIWQPTTGMGELLGSRKKAVCCDGVLSALHRRVVPRCFRMGESYRASLPYLQRPWCVYEAATALRRGVLWCRAPIALSRDGAARERRRLAAGATLALAAWLLALMAFALVLVGLDARAYGLYRPQGGMATLLARLEPHSYLALELLFSAALVALACAVACATLLSRRVVHLRGALLGGGAGLGTGLMFDLGDSAVLGKLLPSRGSPACVLEQMVTWHGQQQPRFGRWWPRPLPWCVLQGTQPHARSGRLIGELPLPHRPPCRPVGGSARWLDGATATTAGWEVRLGDVRAVEGAHWLLCEGGTVAATLRVALGAPAELVAYVAAAVLMQLIKNIDVFSGDRAVGMRVADLHGDGCDLLVDDLGREIVGEAELQARREHCERRSDGRRLMAVEDALTLAVLACLALLSATAHGGALLAWARARLLGCRAAVLHCASGRGSQLPWAEMVLTVAKAVVPRLSKMETAALVAPYEAIGALNVALALFALAKMLLSLDDKSPLGTAGYTLGRPSPSRVAVRPRTRSNPHELEPLSMRDEGDADADTGATPKPSTKGAAAVAPSSRKRSSLGARVVGMEPAAPLVTQPLPVDSSRTSTDQLLPKKASRPSAENHQTRGSSTPSDRRGSGLAAGGVVSVNI